MPTPTRSLATATLTGVLSVWTLGCDQKIDAPSTGGGRADLAAGDEEKDASDLDAEGDGKAKMKSKASGDEAEAGDDGAAADPPPPAKNPDAPGKAPLREIKSNVVAAGAGSGGGPNVVSWDRGNPDAPTANFFAFDQAFTGGARVAVGDVDGDKVPDLISGAGPGGGPAVHVTSRTGADMGSFIAYDLSFAGGIYVAAGDLDGDGKDEIVVGAGEGGGPHVKVFDGRGTELRSFLAFPAEARFGVRVAAGDVDGDGKAEIIAAAGAGGGPHVKIFRADGTEMGGFFAYDQSFTGGVFVAAGDVDGDGKTDIVTGPGTGGGPDVRVYDAKGELRKGFTPFDPAFTGGVRVATTDIDGDASAEIVVGAGPGAGPHVKILRADGGELASFFAFDQRFTGGVYVGGLPRR